MCPLEKAFAAVFVPVYLAYYKTASRYPRFAVFMIVLTDSKCRKEFSALLKMQ